MGHAKILPAHIHVVVRSISDDSRGCHSGSVGVVTNEGVIRSGCHRSFTLASADNRRPSTTAAEFWRSRAIEDLVVDEAIKYL